MALCSAGDYPAAAEVSRSALLLTRDASTAADAAQASATLAFSLRRMGDFSAAQPIAESGLSLARSSGDRAVEGELLSNLAGLAAETGDLVECFRLDEEYLAITRETGDRAREINALNTLGDNALRLGDYLDARKHLDEALSLSHSIGHRLGECVVLLNLAANANLQNNYMAAIGFAKDSIAISARSGLRDLEAAALLPLGLAQIELDEVDAARAALQRSRPLFQENTGPHLAMEPIAGLAYLALTGNDIETAVGHVEVILQHLENDGSLDGTEEPLRILWTLYVVLEHTGDKRAISLLADAHRQLQERAHRITDARSRRVFLTRVPHNRTIQSAWEKQSTGRPPL